MANSRAAKGSVRLANYTCTSAEGTKTFTFTGDFAKYSAIEVFIDVEATLALEMRMQLNGDTNSIYFTDGRTIAGGTETLIDLNDEASWRIIDATALSAVGKTATSKTTIMSCAVGGGINARTESSSGDNIHGEAYTHLHNVETINITSITILTSTSTWKVGTRITITGISR